MQRAHTHWGELTTRQVHKHFSDNFVPIHRVYIGRDCNRLYSDAKDYFRKIRDEMIQQLVVERKYAEIREQILQGLVSEGFKAAKGDQTIEDLEDKSFHLTNKRNMS